MPTQSIATTSKHPAAPAGSVLELRELTFTARSASSLRLHNVSCTLAAGELMVLQIERSASPREAVSMIQGLVAPTSGEVLFQGQPWHDQNYPRHFRMRSRIGRVFDGQAWINHCNVYENVTLAKLHHGWDPRLVNQEYHRFLEYFAVEDVSRQRPAFVEPATLAVYQWIRALLGTPLLLILERPMKDVASSALLRLIEAVDQALSGGAAVMWFTSNPREVESLSGRVSHQVRIQGDRWNAVEGDFGHE